ncbi:MAG: hypothetical protein V8T86_01060 [Victivallis sp.]
MNNRWMSRILSVSLGNQLADDPYDRREGRDRLERPRLVFALDFSGHDRGGGRIPDQFHCDRDAVQAV